MLYIFYITCAVIPAIASGLIALRSGPFTSARSKPNLDTSLAFQLNDLPSA